ncbi:redoxin domain-containing protein [Brucella tritici]|uniref:Redoxin domain-containing protein n=1 Tax=Brucella tritici TaxID=94626 RepID=A0A6L3YN73_9HYPH|nr:redoxin domain-containing protein [Brucella tritici]KAB2684372.1 redoxin domain-containing protein [Brucella tritici]
MLAKPAPPLTVSTWLNSDQPLNISDFAGRILIIEAFQMLCPGCVSHGLPQVQRIAQIFPSDKVAVIGLHTVFEHHEAQGTETALSAFAAEYKLKFPIGIDKQVSRIPVTMTAYEMQGTPTLIVVDQKGVRRFQHFGHVDDLLLGSIIGSLIGERPKAVGDTQTSITCGPEGCTV